MMKIGRSVMAAVVLVSMITGVSGCEKKEGPMERTGRSIDNGAEKTGQQIDKAIEKTGEKIETAGDKIKNSVR